MTGATRDCSYRGVWLRSAGAERSSQLLRHPANKPTTPAAASTPAVPVVAEQVKSSDVPIYLGGIGTVQAYNTVTVHSQITGPITQIDFTEGQLVHTGDLLAQIDPRPYQAQVDQAIANKARDQAQLANAQQILERNLPLLPKGFVAQQTVETEKDQVAQAAATVQADEAQIESARVQLSYTRLSSPFELQPISVIFTLPETDLPRIQEAMAKGTLTVLADSQDNKILLDKGTLTVLDNQIVQTSGTYFAGIKRAS
jgi:multidrug efflux system membrane fusion protein